MTDGGAPAAVASPGAVADPARAVHLARMQQQADAAAAAAKAAASGPLQQQAERVAFNSLLVNGVLDEKHHSASALVSALDLLRRVVGNVLDHPHDAKYRAVKLSSAAYCRSLQPLGAPLEKLLCAAGWRTRTVELERAWVFEGAEGGADWRRLEMAREVLGNAAAAMEAKAARAERERQARMTRGAAEQERLRLALADDQQLRALDYEARRRTNPAASEWQPGQQQQQQQQQQQGAGAAGAAAAGGQGDEDGDDEK